MFSQTLSAGNFANGEHALQVRAIDTAGNQVMKQVKFLIDYCFNELDGTTNCQYVQSLEDPPEPIIIEPSYSDPPYLFVWLSSSIAFISIILMIFVIRAGMSGPKRKKSDDDYDDDDWMSEFIGTTQQVDYDAITNTNTAPVVEEKDTEDEEPEDDPFSVNVVQRRARRTKSKAKVNPNLNQRMMTRRSLVWMTTNLQMMRKRLRKQNLDEKWVVVPLQETHPNAVRQDVRNQKIECASDRYLN